MKEGIQAENNIIQYLCGEMDVETRSKMAEALACDPVLQQEVEMLTEAQAYSREAVAYPSEDVVNRILTYAKQEQWTQKSRKIDKT